MPSSISNGNRELRIEILCEALWTLNNLVAEEGYDIDIKLQSEGVRDQLHSILLENFTGDAYMVNCAQKIN